MTRTTETKKTIRKRASARSEKLSAGARKGSAHSNGAMALQDYGRSATRFIAKSQQALSQLYGWADRKGRQIPDTIKGMHLPDSKSLHALAEDKSLALGAVGLGIGVLIGAMLPMTAISGSTARRRGKSASSRRHH